MGAVLTCVNTFKQSLTGSAFESISAATGDSTTILNYAPGSYAAVEEVWAGNNTTKMEVAIFSPRFGDNQYGLRMQQMFNPTLSGADGVPQLLLPEEIDIPVYNTDVLTVQVNGAASDNANVGFQVFYENVPGVSARLASWDSVHALTMQANVGNSRTLAVEVTVTPGTTGNYGTSVALNANDDRLVANADYALLGYTCDQPTLCFGIRGPDTGFNRIPMPGHWNARQTSGWFIRQARQRNAARIPIISSNNKGVTYLDAIHPANSGATKLSLLLAQLASPFNG
jgi:hypothetical protein